MWTPISLHTKLCNICVACLSCGRRSTGFVCWFYSLLLSTWLSWIWYPRPPKKSGLRNLTKEGTKTFKFLADEKTLFCKVSEKAYENVVKKSQIGQHVGSKTHEKNRQLKWKRNVTQAQLEDCFARKWRNHGLQLLEKSSVKPSSPLAFHGWSWTCPNSADSWSQTSGSSCQTEPA